MVDAKVVRQRHLEGLGSQSYGGLVRPYLKGISSVALIGGGQLASEIIPWVIRKAELTVFCRDMRRAEALACALPQLHTAEFAMAPATLTTGEMGLVVAAPLTAHEIESWVALQSTRFVKAIDLRGEAAFDHLRFSFPVIELSEIYSTVKPKRREVAASLEAARAEINLATERLANQAQFRPFGWEDLCA
jgi:glutamyl-tRNA reductase